MSLWHVSSSAGFFYITASTRRYAHMAGVNEWGRIPIKVRLATEQEKEKYKQRMK